VFVGVCVFGNTNEQILYPVIVNEFR
jgi:hypothetical protein